MKKWYLIPAVLAITLLVVSCEPSAAPPETTDAEPAAFSVSNLSIQPTQVQPGEAVNISVFVANTGGTEGSYAAVLKINGAVEAGETVTIAAGGSQTVTFSVTRNEASSYTIAVGGLSDSFTVVAPPATFEPIVITGSGYKTSPPFTITTEEWIIDWSYVPDPEYPEFAVFGFFIYPRGETVLYVGSVLFPEGTSGSTYSYAGAGEYYINVSAANVKSWEVIISPP